MLGMAHAVLQVRVPPRSSQVVCCAREAKAKAPGKCWLIGAGPGSVDFLTVSAASDAVGRVTLGCD